MTTHRAFNSLLLITILALVAANWRSIGDPFIRHDDFPALLGFEDVVSMTLNEGRWLNYWWVARDFLWPPQVHFALYFLGWAVFCAAVATSSFGPGTALVWRALLAVLMALAPLHFNIAQWFNTLVPGVWVLAVYAVLAMWTRWQVAAVLLLIFAPVAFSAYTTYPFLMFTALAMRHDLPLDRRTYMTLAAAFVAAFALSILSAYALNWFNYGVFGIEAADWRNPNPLKSMGDLTENLGQLSVMITQLVMGLGMGYARVGLLVFSAGILALYALFRIDRVRSGFVITPVIFGLGLLSANLVLTGVAVPVRAALFLWLAMIYAMIRFADHLSSNPPRRIATSMLLGTLAFFYGYQIDRNIRLFYTGWQSVTRDMAARIPSDSSQIRIHGDFAALPQARFAQIQSTWGLRMRLEYLTGVPAVDCTEVPEACFGETPAFEAVQKPQVRFLDGIAHVRLPEKPE